MKPDEQRTGSKSTGWPIASLVLFISLIASILYSLPQFMRMYEEMLPGDPLPALTRLFCAVSPIAYIGIMAAGVVLILFMHFAIRSPRSCRRIHVAVALLSVMAFVVYVIALFLPIT
jgi:type II secretory pathway component PulF